MRRALRLKHSLLTLSDIPVYHSLQTPKQTAPRPAEQGLVRTKSLTQSMQLVLSWLAIMSASTGPQVPGSVLTLYANISAPRELTTHRPIVFSLLAHIRSCHATAGVVGVTIQPLAVVESCHLLCECCKEKWYASQLKHLRNVNRNSKVRIH